MIYSRNVAVSSRNKPSFINHRCSTPGFPILGKVDLPGLGVF